MLHLLSLWSCLISLYLCGGVTSTETVTTNPQDFDNERFSLVTHSLLEDSGYDFRLATCFMSLTYTSLCCLRLKFEETVHSIKPTITTEMIYMTEPRQGPALLLFLKDTEQPTLYYIHFLLTMKFLLGVLTRLYNAYFIFDTYMRYQCVKGKETVSYCWSSGKP